MKGTPMTHYISKECKADLIEAVDKKVAELPTEVLSKGFAVYWEIMDVIKNLPTKEEN